MNKILLIILNLFFANILWAQQVSEEAIILNQELQFLEEASNQVSISSNQNNASQDRSGPLELNSLEQKYFGNDTQDSIKTKKAAPKRRGN